MINIQTLTQKILSGETISYETGVELIHHPEKKELYDAADTIRKHFCGNKMDLCSITNAKSGACSENCKWCSQSAHHTTDVERYELIDKEKAVAEASENAKNGVHRHSLVTSGRTISDNNLQELLSIYKEIKNKSKIDLCASMGLLSKSQLKKLKEAGISHYHCNLETAPSFFPKVCSTHTIEDKIKVIQTAQNLGIKVCSGGIIGLGETAEQRVELACALANLGIQSIPINILTPIEGTPLAKAKPLDKDEILSTIAVFRFINPRANIRFAGGRLLIKDFENEALHAGINSALTGNYLTTIGSDTQTDIKNFKSSGFSIDA
jgi:biotin synthase